MIEYMNKRNKQLKKPLPIVKYNKFMGGVNLQNQMSSYYPCERKTLRLYKKLDLYIIQLLLLNITFSVPEMFWQKISYEFRLGVIEELLAVAKKTTPHPKTTATIPHYITKISDLNAIMETIRKHSRSCHKNKIRKYTLCNTCM